jgi:hypothetical protein
VPEPMSVPHVSLVAGLGCKVLVKQFSDALCQIVGDAQVLAKKGEPSPGCGCPITSARQLAVTEKVRTPCLFRGGREMISRYSVKPTS